MVLLFRIPYWSQQSRGVDAESAAPYVEPYEGALFGPAMQAELQNSAQWQFRAGGDCLETFAHGDGPRGMKESLMPGTPAEAGI